MVYIIMIYVKGKTSWLSCRIAFGRVGCWPVKAFHQALDRAAALWTRAWDEPAMTITVSVHVAD